MKKISIKAAWVSLVVSSIVAILLGFGLDSGNAAESGSEQESRTEELAKETQNPVANLISVPFQNNFNFGIGPNDATQWVLKCSAGDSDYFEQGLEPDYTDYHTHHQPAVSRRRNTERVRAGRHQPQPVPLAGEFWQTDLGVGPTMTFPTATDSLLGNGKWSAGPGLVLLTMPGHWVIGALANNQWSFAGWGKNNGNTMLIQPFLNYNFPHGWYLTSSPIITANWLAASDDRWTVPIGGGVGKLFRLGKLPVNTQLAAYSNVVKPRQGGADWQLRFQVQFLFPK